MDSDSMRTFLARAVVASLALVVTWGLLRGAWVAAAPILVVYLGVIFAIGLRGAADWLVAKTPLGPRVALGIVLLLTFGLPVGVGVLLAPSFQKQMVEAERE